MATETSARSLSSWRLTLTYVFMGLIFAAFAGRLYQLQILEGETYQLAADDNRLEQVNIPAPRGIIYDRNGAQLVRNVPAFNVYVTPASLPESLAEIELIYQRISDLTGVPVDQAGERAAPCVPGRGIRQLVDEGASIEPFQPWPVACDVDDSTARVLREMEVDLAGVSVEPVAVREYTTGALTSAVIGYLGPIPAAFEEFYRELGFEPSRDKVGYAGIEGEYQEILAGQNGRKVVEEDVAGQALREVGTVIQPTPGNNLRLTIDARLQAAAETALRNRMDFINRFAGDQRTPLGVAIAMNPQTGEILAMVTLPTYENNRLARFIPLDYYSQLEADQRGNPLSNHAIQSEFPPGSTFKMVTATGALNEGVVSPEQRLFDPGLITISNRYFPNDPGKAKDFVCWLEEGHGSLSFVEGVAFSCNVYFYKIGGGYENEVPGGGLGIERLGVYARALGYGAPLGIDLPAEQDGLIPSPDWKRINLGESWSTGDTYNSVVGQGFVGATPLQVLTSIATLANGGNVMWPHLVSEILDGEGNVVERIEPCVLWNIADGVLTPLEQIGAGCPRVPEAVRTSRGITPDVNVDPEVIALTQRGMQLVVSEGTAEGYANLDTIASGGKTGTGEFCDEVARSQNLCEPGNWPTHSWYVAYAPLDNPEIAVLAFVYNGGEGAVTAGPVVRQILEAYFTLKAIDAGSSS